VLPIVRITKHQYYYQSKGKRSGKKPSMTTERVIGQIKELVNNQDVINQIKIVQSDPETNYGYRKMYFQLMLLGYFINHKKVYRLMKQNNLLKEKYKRTGKKYAKYRIVIPQGPLQVIEMDIKYVWIVQANRHAFILTIIDTFTRVALQTEVGFTMKASQVKQAWEKVIVNYLQPADLLSKQVHIEIRNDNGPQFAAKLIQNFFKDNYLDQVFTHPYTPQENGHIESFHSILSRSLENHGFWDIYELDSWLTMFYNKYNNVRLHGSTANLPPKTFWGLWEQGKITRKVLKNKKVKFNLNVPYQELSGKMNLREVPCLNFDRLNANQNLSGKISGPASLKQPSVQKSPSVVPC
jgi:transposase InsO family protein